MKKLIFIISCIFLLTANDCYSFTSDNDYTNEEKAKLAAIEAGAEANPALVSQADAEAGTSETEYSWSPLRVYQAIVALVTGDVTGPAGAVSGNLPELDATGKILSDSGSKVDGTAYDATSWDDNPDVADKDALRDKFFAVDASLGNKYDSVDDIPEASPSSGDTTHFSFAGSIYSWATGLFLQSEVDGSVSNELQTIDVSELDGTTLKLSLSSDGEATKEIELSSINTDTQLTDEEVQDKAGSMWAGNTETRATVTYQDDDGTIDIVVEDMNDPAETLGTIQTLVTNDFHNLGGVDANTEYTDTDFDIKDLTDSTNLRTAWNAKTDSLDQVITIAASGGDYTTIQSALTANSSGHECFLVAPDTYVNDTINFTANNQTVIAAGKPNQTIITNSAQIVEAGDYTSCTVANMNIQFNPTTAINAIEVNDGALAIRDCKLTLTTSSTITGSTQPALLATTGTGDLSAKRGEFYYYHTGNTTTGIKAILSVATGSTVEILRACKVIMTNSGTALATSFVIDAGTALFDLAGIQEMTITDTTSGVIAGLGYIGGSGDSHFDYCHINVVGGGGNACYGIYNAGTGRIRSSHNDIYVSGGSTNYSFYTAAGATTDSHLDDIRAADGYLNSGTFNIASSMVDGGFTASGTIAGGTITGTNVTSGADPGHTHTAYIGPVGPILNNGDTSAGYIDFLEDSDNGTNYLRLLGPPSTDTVTISLPSEAGIIVTDVTACSDLEGDGLSITTGTLNVATASTTAAGIAEFTIASEVTTGTSAVLAVTPDSLAGSDYGKRFLSIALVESDTAVTVIDGTVGIPITSELNGWNIVDAQANVRTKGVTGTTDIQIRKQTGASDADVLSTKLTLGDEYYCSDEVINTSNDALSTGDMLFVDVDAVHSGTAPNGLSVVIVVQLP